jgi:hypothetical protein
MAARHASHAGSPAASRRVSAQDLANDDALEVTSPTGWKAAVKGRDLMFVILLLSACALGYAHHDASRADLREVKDKFEEMIYVLSLPQAEREKLNLTMPDSLRVKMRRRRDE